MNVHRNRRQVISSRPEAELGQGLHLVLATFEDGEERLWLMNENATAEDTTGCACAWCAPHEQLRPRVEP